MHKFFRSVLLTGMVAIGVAACGDDVTIVDPPPPPPPPAPAVKSITVTPDGASIVVDGKILMTAAVNADPGVATTVTWSSSDPTKASVLPATGEVTGKAPGAVGIKATSTVNPAVQGSATLTVVAAPTATVTGVSVNPPSASLLVGQQVQAGATVQGTNNPSQAVNWSSTNETVATVSASGLITAVAPGGAQIRATSVANSAAVGTIPVTVTPLAEASVSLAGLTQGNLATPVLLNSVNGQIEATINIESGDYQLDRVVVLIGGTPVASQSFNAAPAAAGSDAPATVAQTVVLSFNTNQLRKLANDLLIPVIFNGPQQATAFLYVQGATQALASNAIELIITNTDMMIAPTSFTQVATAGPVSAGGSSWYKGTTALSGGNYISFFPVTPTSITFASTGGCSSTGNMITGTYNSGIALAGNFACGAAVENAVNVGAYSVAAGTPPAADVIYNAAAGYTQVGSMFIVEGSERYNPLAAAAPVYSNIFIDNQGPSVTFAVVGFHSLTCSGTSPNPGCWIKNSYDIAARVTLTDPGSGSAGGNVKTLRNYTGGLTCSGTDLPTATGADYAETTVVESYQACSIGTDPLGNETSSTLGIGTAQASAPFSVDNTPPTLTYMGDYTIMPVPDVVNLLPAAGNSILDYGLIDNNSGIDAALGLQITYVRTLNNGGMASSTACAPGGGWTTLVNNDPAPATLATPIDLETFCLLPGEQLFTAVGFDRAGNQSINSIARALEYNPAAPALNAVNILPLYAGGADANFDVFATDDEDLTDASLGLTYETDGGAFYEVVFGPRAGFFTNLFGSSWDGLLYLSTPAAGVRLTLPGTYVLAGLADGAGALPGEPGAFSQAGVNVTVFDSWGATSTTNVGINAAFKTAASFPVGNPWAGGTGTSNETFVNVGGFCTWSYETATNNPTVLTRIWAADNDGAGVLTVLADISATPALVSDGIAIRVYRHIIGAGTCAALGADQIIAVQGGVGFVY